MKALTNLSTVGLSILLLGALLLTPSVVAQNSPPTFTGWNTSARTDAEIGISSSSLFLMNTDGYFFLLDRHENYVFFSFSLPRRTRQFFERHTPLEMRVNGGEAHTIVPTYLKSNRLSLGSALSDEVLDALKDGNTFTVQFNTSSQQTVVATFDIRTNKMALSKL